MILVSNILNEGNVFDQIGRVLGIEIDNDSEIFSEIEQFIVEKFDEMCGEVEWNVESSVEVVDEDGEHVEDITVQVNIFAKGEDEAMEKAEDNIREQNPQWDDFCIDIASVTEV
jgi:hypothetical protein